jgi:hypothetical protein
MVLELLAVGLVLARRDYVASALAVVPVRAAHSARAEVSWGASRKTLSAAEPGLGREDRPAPLDDAGLDGHCVTREGRLHDLDLKIEPS